LSFDISVLEIFLPLCSGAKLVLASRSTASDGEALLAEIKYSSASVMQATPTTWRMLIATGWSGGGQLKVLCGGEAWSRDLANDLVSRCSSVWNMYGPTETTIWSAVQRIESGDDPVLIGRPIANTQLYILDEHGQPVPIGVHGELYIGGAGLARGYLNRPELTAERFVANPFSDVADDRLYRTGDKVRYRPERRIEFLGRLDQQVKIRGFRIELGEIETVLSGLTAVKEAVVVAREDVPGDQRLVAYLVAEPGADLSTDELRRGLAAQLPDYMLPTAWVMLDSLPLTPNQKIDRNALPEPDARCVVAGYQAPVSSDEEILAGIWAEVLRLDRVGVHDNFFALGGHSRRRLGGSWPVDCLAHRNEVSRIGGTIRLRNTGHA
jgi:acyl-CoA synthetase (AMP-forming)/AMP-acid ligase II